MLYNAARFPSLNTVVLPKKPVTLAEIARRAGVSVMTVSRALRKQSNISPETQKKIQAIADQLGYRPNPLVSALMTYSTSRSR